MMLAKGDDSAFSVEAEKLQAAVLEHIRDEEDKAFPDLEKHADSTQAAMLTKSVREFRAALHFQTSGTK